MEVASRLIAFGNIGAGGAQTQPERNSIRQRTDALFIAYLEAVKDGEPSKKQDGV